MKNLRKPRIAGAVWFFLLFWMLWLISCPVIFLYLTTMSLVRLRPTRNVFKLMGIMRQSAFEQASIKHFR